VSSFATSGATFEAATILAIFLFKADPFLMMVNGD